MVKFQYYIGGIKSIIPTGYITVDEFVNKIREPNPKTRLLLRAIQFATTMEDKELKSELKEKLPFFTPSVIIKDGMSRRYENIERFTGLCQIDFDKFDNLEQAQDCKHWLFDQNEEIACAFISPSGLGVKALARIPISKDIDEFQDYYRALTNKYKVELKIPNFDIAPQNAVLPLFYSHDINVLSQEADVWYEKIKKPIYVPNGEVVSIRYGSPLAQNLMDKFYERINNITDNGHPQFRRACLMLGSLVSGNFLTEFEAETAAENAIRSNQYLSTAHSFDTYFATALWGIKKGMLSPFIPNQ